VAISAWVEGKLSNWTNVKDDGTFTLLVAHQPGQSYAGKLIIFKVGECVAAQSAPWRRGGTELVDLTVTANP
jgi:hypothetical protein